MMKLRILLIVALLPLLLLTACLLATASFPEGKPGRKASSPDIRKGFEHYE